MAKVNALIHSFNSGELSKAGLARVDQDKVRLCAELQENLIPYTIGKAIMRPGTKYLGTLSSSTTLTNTPPRIIPFVKSISTKYVIELNYQEIEVTEEVTENEETTYYTTIGNEAVSLPAGSYEIDVKMIGGGATGTRAGGGGGAYAATSSITVTSAQTVYINVGNHGGDSWVNVSGNIAPSSTSQGALAKGGSGAAGGSSASCIGDTCYSGGNGGSYGGTYTTGGGGGGAAGVNGTGKNGYTDGGGGGSNGGLSTDGTSTTGGNGTGGTGGGAVGTSGTLGGGGGRYSGAGNAGSGGSDTTFGSTYGSGGGGGGGNLGHGGGYGGGGGGYFADIEGDFESGFTTTYGTAGTGSQGIVAITVRYRTSSVSGEDSGYIRVWNNDSVTSYSSANSDIGDISTFTTSLIGGATATLSATGFTSRAPYSGGYAIIKKEVSTSSVGIEHAIKIIITNGSCEFRVGSSDEDDDLFNSTTISVGTHVLSFTPQYSNYFITFVVSTQYYTIASLIENYNTSQIDIRVSAPWSQDGLRSIRYDQSLDVIFMSVPDSEPYKIERRGAKSWSVAKYLTSDGPFMTAKSNSNVRISPSATRGNVTLTASSTFFKDYHEGVLFKLTHSSLNATYGLGAEKKYTRPFRQTGVVISAGTNDDRAFSIVVSGTWVGTLRIERSFDDQYSGFREYGAAITANGTTNINGSSEDDNAIIWYRVIFDAYTSGSATINIVYPGYGGNGVCRITSVTNSTSAEAEVISDFYNTEYTEDWVEGEWSSHRGFPTAVALFDGRLWWARRDRFWGSESDNYYNFDATAEGDSASIQRDVATGGTLAEVQWILPLQRLVFGSAGAESSARASSLDEPLTAKALTVKDGSTHGASNVTPVKVDGRGLYVQRSQRKLMELSFAPSANDYMATDLTRYNEDICTSLNGVRITNLVDDDVIELSVQRHPDTYVWVLRDDGVIPVVAYNPTQEVTGWFRITLGRSATGFGSFLKHDKAVSIAVIPSVVEDNVYLVVHRRTDPDTYSYFIEKMSMHQESIYTVLSDAGTNETISYNGLYQLDSYEISNVSSDGATVAVSPRLNGSSVMVIGPHYNSSGTLENYGPIGGEYVVDDSGYITLSDVDENRAGDTVTIGLPYTGKYKSAKLAYGAQAGTAMAQKKRITDVALLLSDYHPSGVTVGPDFDNLDDLPAIVDGNAVEYDSSLISATDADMFPFPGEWTTDARICIQVSPGYSATLNGIVLGVDTNEQ